MSDPFGLRGFGYNYCEWDPSKHHSSTPPDHEIQEQPNATHQEQPLNVAPFDIPPEGADSLSFGGPDMYLYGPGPTEPLEEFPKLRSHWSTPEGFVDQSVEQTTPNETMASAIGLEAQQSGNFYGSDSDSSDGGVPLPLPDFGHAMNTIFTKSPTPSFANMHPTDKLHKGELAHESLSFVPWDALSKFPYRYIDKDVRSEFVASYFEGLKLYDYEWPLYFIYPPREFARDAMILTTDDAVREFLEKISKEKTYPVLMPVTASEDGLVLTFPEHDVLRARALGTCRSFDDYLRLSKNVPSEMGVKLTMLNINMPDESEDALFRDIMQRAYDLIKYGGQESNPKDYTADKAKKIEKRTAKMNAWQTDLKRLCQVFGMRSSRMPREDLTADATWDEYKEHFQEEAKPLFVDLNRAVPFKHPREPVVIAIDVEWFEKDNTKITEIGIASFDTRDIGSMPLGLHGVHWHELVHATHLRIKENLHLRNSQYVADAADDFMFNGEEGSEVVSLQDVPSKLGALFKEPFCKTARPGPNAAYLTKELEKLRNAAEPRHIVLLGHGVQNDIEKLGQAGFDATGPAARVVDTADVHCALTGSWEPASLEAVLDELEQEPWGLHNAGNDAVYTLWAALGIAVEAAVKRAASTA